MVVDGDRIAVRHTHYATQAGEFAGIPPTGRRVTVPGIEILRLRDGQIVEFWHHDDFLALMQQLGAIPSPHSGS
jgi:predicted ester cyclase